MATDPAGTTDRSQTPMVCRGLDTYGGPGFVRERLELYSKTVFLLSIGFWVALTATWVFIGGAPWRSVVLNSIALSHVLASSFMGGIWLVTRRTPCSLKLLGVLDAASLVVPCTLLAGMMIWDDRQILQTLLAIMVTVMARAILVPSTPKRTAVLSTMAFLPVLVCTILFARPVPDAGISQSFMDFFVSVNTVAWGVLGVALATVTSQVTYGLRKQVAEASDIGQYILEEKIGGGGMGEIWRARHRLLIRPAAVKLIRRQQLGSMPGDPELLMRRFEREARATAALKSPHTVQLYDFGVTEDGTLYYVMELLDGLDLDTLVKRHGPVPAERAIHILRQVCSSLADAHGNGLVHRDIKPANIVVSRIGTTFDFVKVLDFGLVKLDGARRGDDDALKLTAVGSTSGTPGFMAPEVALAANETDHRVDLYSLGCVAYWLLTGKLVFEGESALKVMIDHARTPPRRPSGRVEVPIPNPLEDLIMECLEKDPDRRPESAEILSERLEALAGSGGWTPDRAERWWGAHMPSAADSRPIADILLSQEGRPIRLGRPARPRG
jgi:serine/threonine-protein kinase